MSQDPKNKKIAELYELCLRQMRDRVFDPVLVAELATEFSRAPEIIEILDMVKNTAQSKDEFLKRDASCRLSDQIKSLLVSKSMPHWMAQDIKWAILRQQK